MKFNKILSIVLISLLVCQPFITVTTRSLVETKQERDLQDAQVNVFQSSKRGTTPSQSQEAEELPKKSPTNIKKSEDNKVEPSLATPPEEQVLSNDGHIKEANTDPISPQQTGDTTYWVTAGSNGNGTSSGNPAGNITYVLTEYNLTDAVVKVEDGTYNTTLEDFPLNINSSNMTLTSVDGSSVTVIHGNTSEDILQIREDNATIQGFTLQEGLSGILLESDHTTVKENNITDCRYGIWLRHSSNNILSGNTMEGGGLFLEGEKTTVTQQTIFTNNTVNGAPLRYYSKQGNIEVPTNTGQVIFADTNNSVISGLNLSHATVGVQLLFSHNNSITYGTYSNDVYGIWLMEGSKNTLVENTLTTNEYGISLNGTSNTTISNNTITSNNRDGIGLSSSSNTTVTNNTITSNQIGIGLVSSSNTTISNNTLTDQEAHIYPHIYLAGSTNTTLTGNTIHEGEYGIYAHTLSTTTITNNTLTNNNYSVTLNGTIETTTTSNTITNSYEGILSHASNDSRIEGNTIRTHQEYGIVLVSSNRTIIRGNEIRNNRRGGIGLWFSDTSIMETNNIINNTYGIALDRSRNVTIKLNNITNNSQYGIDFADAHQNTIMENNITDNQYGVYLHWKSTGNLLYRNNFVGNDINGDTGVGSWFNSTGIGNYWATYEGKDEDGDGIGDSPYEIPGGKSKDYLPAMDPFGVRETTKPEVQITVPEEGTTLEESDITVEWTGQDTGTDKTGISHFEIQLDGEKWINQGRNTSYTFTGVNDGKHTVKVMVIDKAFNSAITSITFEVETGATEVVGGLSLPILIGIGVGFAVVIGIVIYYVIKRR